MARIALLAAALTSLALPVWAQAPVSAPPLPGDDPSSWDAADPDDASADETEEAWGEGTIEFMEDGDEGAPEGDETGAAAGPADAAEAEAYEAYLRTLEAEGLPNPEETLVDEADEVDPEADVSTAASMSTEPGVAQVEASESEPLGYVAENPSFSLLFDGGVNRSGSSLQSAFNIGMRFEGDRGGLLVNFGAMGTHNSNWGVFTLEPSFAVIARERFRWRLRGGWSAAFNDAVSMSGLSLGSSMVIHIAGPLDIELDGHLTPFPFLRVEATAAGALHFGPVSLRLGWRTAYLTDHGIAYGAGSPITTLYNGLYGGVGLHF